MKGDKSSGKSFPDYMKNVILPNEACEQEMEVYRLCKNGTVSPKAFLTTYEEYSKRGRLKELNLNDVRSYSLSTYKKKKDIKRKFLSFTRRDPKTIIAIGKTSGEYGVCAMTKDWKEGYKGSHVDYWLYEGRNPYGDFEEVSVFEL